MEDISGEVIKLNNLVLRLKDHIGTGVLSPNGKDTLQALIVTSAGLVTKVGIKPVTTNKKAVV